MIASTWAKLAILLLVAWYDGHELSSLDCRSFSWGPHRDSDVEQYRAECSTPWRSYTCATFGDDVDCYRMRLQ